MTIEAWHWLVFGLILIIAEMFVPTFFLLWFGVGAIVAACVTFVAPLSFFGSILLWLIFSVICIILWFKFIQPKFQHRTKAGLGASAIIGEIGMIIKSPNELNAGMVRFTTPKAGASEWVCRSQETINIGEKVKIIDIIGNELLVSKI